MVVRKRLDIKGRATAFVTITVTDWLNVFSERQLAEFAVDQLAETLEFYNVSAIGYVLMPSHLHMLLGFRRIELMSKFVQSYKILTAKQVKSVLEDSRTPSFCMLRARLQSSKGFRLWKSRFDDLIIVSDEQFRIKLNYIHNNPVKAGLVNASHDWPYSSASAWSHDIRGPIPIDKTFAYMK